MRNLKKIVAVLLAVALLASMGVSALAATVANTDKALKLQQIGLMAGTEANLNLEGQLNRIQGLTFAIRAAGKEAAALAMSDADVATELAKFTDSATIPGWAVKYAAYGIKNGITVGKGGGKLGAMDPISATSFLVFVLKSGMGYADVTTANIIDKAVAAKVITAGQAVALSLKASLIRDDAAGILYGAVSTGVNADGKALIQALIDANAVDPVKAAAAGFVAPAAATLKVLSATATNLKEIVVAFDSALDKTEAEKPGNITVDAGSVSKAKLNADGKSVTLILTTAMANQSTFKVTVKSAVKSDAGVALTDDVDVSGSVFDVTIPVALSAVQAGPDSFKVTFSEPVVAPTGINFKVDNGLYFVQGVTAGDDGYSATVKLYSTIPTGDHKVEVTAVKDYANYSIVTTNLSFTASKDEVVPTINKIVSASPEKVVIEFSEDIFAVVSNSDIASKVYHTNSANVAATAAIDGKELTLTFTNKLPNGTAYLTIAKEVLKDAWNNKNAEVKDLAIAVTVDTTKPVVSKVEAKTDKQIVITFSEDLNTGVAGTYKILDAAGKDVTGDYTITPTRTATTLTLDFTTALSGSTYTVVLEGLKDLAGNEIDKVSSPVAVTDTTAPVVTTAGILYGSKKIVKISANEVMKSEDLLNLANYQIGSTYLSGTKVTASIADGGKAVLLDLSKESTLQSDPVTVYVGKIRDAAGNYTTAFSTTVVCNNVDNTGIAISKVEATGKKTIVVTLADSLSTFEANDFIVDNATVSGVSFANNADGKGVITFTITEELTTTAVTTPGSAFITVSTSTGGINSANAFGVKVAAGATSGNAADKISAEIVSAAFNTTGDAITVTFSENIKADTLSRFTFNVSGNTVTAATVGSNTIELTLKDAVSTTGTKVTLTQVLNIEDTQGNVTTGLTKEVTK